VPYDLALQPYGLQTVPPGNGPTAETFIRLALPIAGGILTTSGLLLGWRGHELAPWLLVSGALLTITAAAGEVLEAEQTRGRL
jgi:hypothetical protein